MVEHCPSENTQAIDQSTFWSEDGINWTTHRVGWTISGGFALLTTIITIAHVGAHGRHYHVPAEQRQILRILYMPSVFAIISWLSYRFFRYYTYYALVQIAYEAFTISAFLLLIIQYVANTADRKTAEDALERKGKDKLPLPFCCWKYRPTKPYFMYAVKWSVMQYTIIRPAASVAGMITEHYHLLCESSWSYKYANVWLVSIDFVSISVALYGLVLFYGLTKAELNNRRPLAKFLCIKLIVIFTFYQTFVFSALQKYGVIKATEFWTASNIADGLNALVTTFEMVLFAGFMVWAYPHGEYVREGCGRTSIWRAVLNSLNFSDFGLEIYTSLRFFWHVIFKGKSYTREDKDRMEHGKVDFAKAFLSTPRSSFTEQRRNILIQEQPSPTEWLPAIHTAGKTLRTDTSRTDESKYDHYVQRVDGDKEENIGMSPLGRRF